MAVGLVLLGAGFLVIAIWLIRMIVEFVKTAALVTVGLLVAGALVWILATAFQFDVIEYVRPYFESYAKHHA
ncbi:MAG: hypothetical protein QF473_00080 [Planctomycetota bacterium]|nr:hypothetical protein [Planctomycetota bacterium]